MRILITLLVVLLATQNSFADDPSLRGNADEAEIAWLLIEEGALVIDVRSEEEYASGHLPGAVNIPHEETDALIELIGPDPDRSVVLYCGSGRRAENVKQTLEAASYTGIYNATGLDALLATQPDEYETP